MSFTALPQLSLKLAKAMAVLKRKKMDKIPVFKAPYQQRFHGDPLHICFGCSESNDKGLKIKFFKTDVGGLGCRWAPQSGLESFPNIIHGGMLATILDELGGVVIQSDMNAFALTVSASIFYHAPVYLDKPVMGFAKINTKFRRYVSVNGALFSESGKILCSMSSLYFVPPETMFKHLTKLVDYSAEIGSYVAK